MGVAPPLEIHLAPLDTPATSGAKKVEAGFLLDFGLGTIGPSRYRISVEINSPSTCSYNTTLSNKLKDNINTSTLTATSGIFAILLAPVIFHPSFIRNNNPYII